MTDPIIRGHYPTGSELDEIASSWRMSSYFQRMRHTRKCRRCDAWLAVDQPDPFLCSPCQVAENGSRREEEKGGERG